MVGGADFEWQGKASQCLRDKGLQESSFAPHQILAGHPVRP